MSARTWALYPIGIAVVVVFLRGLTRYQGTGDARFAVEAGLAALAFVGIFVLLVRERMRKGR